MTYEQLCDLCERQRSVHDRILRLAVQDLENVRIYAAEDMKADAKFVLEALREMRTAAMQQEHVTVD